MQMDKFAQFIPEATSRYILRTFVIYWQEVGWVHGTIREDKD